MLARPNARLLGATGPIPAGIRLYDQRILAAVDGANQAIPVSALIAGIVNRTGSGGATADSLPTVTSILAALPELTRGDSLFFSIRMPDANAITLTVGTGMTAVGTVNVAASNIRDYLLTLTSDNKQTVIIPCTTTNTSVTLSGFTEAQLKNVGVGMAVTGTGIGAAAKVAAINLTAKTVTVTVASTATADNIAVTFTPQMDILGFGTRAI